MEIPGIGLFEKDDESGWLHGEPMPVPVLGNAPCSFVIDRYDDDFAKDDFRVAMLNFLSIGPSTLKDAEPHIYRYYQDCNAVWEPGDNEYLDIASPEGIWPHIRFGFEAHVSRRRRKEKGIYILLDCNCDWEPEHGLLIVFKNGLTVNKIGQYDGHLTNSDAYADDRFEDTVYRVWESRG